MTEASGHIGIGAEVHQRGRHRQAVSTPRLHLWDRQLHRYPDTMPRFVYLGIVVLATITLYYEFYVPGAVSPSIMRHYGMTFPFFVYLLVVANLAGAFASLVAGLADRWGRANMVAYGLLITALITLFGLPYAPNLWWYGVFYSMLGFVEGIILVATPALIRDFSPQLGRASAMAFWTMGPVVASLTVSLVASHTLNHLTAWEDQLIICGIVGLVVFVIALFGLRELSPGLRDQLMVSTKERALVEARAAGIDVEESLRHPWRQMLKPNIVVPALGIGIFLIIYYTLIAFLVPYMGSIFGYSQLRGNLLGNWIWAFNIGALLVVGLLSDKIRVRKPFMILGAAVAMTATAFFAVVTTHPDTTYYTFVVILSTVAVGLGLAYAPWMAAFTETAEARNPALIATGLAIWGWVLRLVVGASLFMVPLVVTTMTPIVEHGTEVQVLAAKYAPQLATLGAIDPATTAKLAVNPTNPAAVTTAVGEISRQLHVTPAVALQQLIKVGQVPKADLAYLSKYGPQVQKAAAAAPHEWQRWWWICFGAEAVLIPTVFFMKGRWSPKAARNDDLEHEKMIEEELATISR